MKLNEATIQEGSVKRQSPTQFNIDWSFSDKDSLVKYQFFAKNETNSKHILKVKDLKNAQVWIMRVSNSFQDDENF